MRHFRTIALILALLSVGTASPALAQTSAWAAGWGVGALYTTSLNSGSDGTVDIAPELNWSLGFHVDHWLEGGRVGLQAHTALSRPTVAWAQGDRDIPLYGADLSVLLRPTPPGAATGVFLNAGLGFNRWALGDGPNTTFPSAEAAYDGNEGFNLVGVVGLGIDLDLGRSMGDTPFVLRLSARDEIQRSPLSPLDSGDGDFGIVHNLRISIGLSSR